MADRSEAIKAEIIEQVAQLVRVRVQPSEAELVERFVRRFFRDVAAGDLVGSEPQDLYGAALALLRFGELRSASSPLVRVYNPTIEQHGWQSRHTIVEIVNDDMPFLVDSVALELQRHGLTVHLTIHPVIPVGRDMAGRLAGLGGEEGHPESFMHVEVDRLAEPSAQDALAADLLRVLGDVRRAVTDWERMIDHVAAAIADLGGARGHIEAQELDEAVAFLRWVHDHHFTFLGYVEHRLVEGGDGPLLERVPGTPLGLQHGLPDGISESFAELPARVRAIARDPSPPLIVTKANTKSTVHRASFLDVISVKRYGANGTVQGEHRFLGLFTSAAYSLSPLAVPLLRRKVEAVLDRSGFPRGGHAGKALANILQTFPRDELFQCSLEDLSRIAIGILHLQERHRLRLFVRTDRFGRFVTCQIFVPRERFNTALRERMQRIIENALQGTESEFHVQLGESALARLLFMVRTPQGVPDDFDPEEIERRLTAAAQSWTDLLLAALVENLGEAEGKRLFRAYGRDVPQGYQEAVPARAAVTDLQQIAGLDASPTGSLALSLFRRLEDPPGVLHFKVLRADHPVPLSDVLPVLERMGLRVLAEHPFQLRGGGGRSFAIHDFLLEPVTGTNVAVEELRPAFQATFQAVWERSAENDGFNRLVLLAGLDLRRIVILRAYCKYLLQLGILFSQTLIENVLATNHGIARLLALLFDARLAPGRADRDAEVEQLEAAIEAALDSVQSLDEDRILRAYLGLIRATLRTNGFQVDAATGGPKACLSFKFDCARVPGMPAPRPLYEIWVYGVRVEAVHLRGGRVARGGIRWSDRREDFRTEVLGLMKAQMVKNSVIVPVGAKGGFFVKRPPPGGDRAAMQEEAIACYRMFLQAMLDITDNRAGETIVPPPEVVRYDDDDPYLVVAADKGTATFSDIANGIARDYGFWLDDAFASGGSAGYDHKAMGITARGAWEAVRRHFRELGLDPAADSFTCVGIGDMSGDVFGNGMLLSDRIRLLAAFDHRHIFIDPAPDPAIAFAERQRLFALPRSSWADYDRSRLSSGAGIFPRTLKSIQLSREAQAALGLARSQMTPPELINALLKAPVDLLWNGGIGTYVKASDETHADAHDRTNDVLRVNGAEMRARTVAEGGNLGLTQRGRIEYAAAGGRINTDFIDNSAGVDCSDHEVNIKILLNAVVAAGDLTTKQRDLLLAEMTDEVATLVLRDNVLQNVAISMSQRIGPSLLDAEQRLIRRLEQAGQLDRALELLPGDEELTQRRRDGRGLSRPEAAVLLAYSKMTLYEAILASGLPDRRYFAHDLAKYFPRPIRRRFAADIGQHRLRREIVATWLANSVVNRGLHVFVSELTAETGADLEEIILAFVLARDALGLISLYSAVENLPRSVSAERQLDLFVRLRDVLVAGTRWFLAATPRPIEVTACVARFRPGITEVMGMLDQLLAPSGAADLQGRIEAFEELGITPETGRALASVPHLLAAADIVLLTEEARSRSGGEVALVDAGRVYFALDETLELGTVREHMRTLPVRTRWDRLALTHLEEQTASAQRQLSLHLLAAGTGDAPEIGAAVRQHLEEHLPGYRAHRELMAELAIMPDRDLAVLSVAARQLAKLASGRT